MRLSPVDCETASPVPISASPSAPVIPFPPEVDEAAVSPLVSETFVVDGSQPIFVSTLQPSEETFPVVVVSV